MPRQSKRACFIKIQQHRVLALGTQFVDFSLAARGNAQIGSAWLGVEFLDNKAAQLARSTQYQYSRKTRCRAISNHVHLP